MKDSGKYCIPLKTLKDTVSVFTYTLDKTFFARWEETNVQDGNIEAILTVKKIGDSFEITTNIAGSVVVPCDRCLAPMEANVTAEDTFMVRLEGDDLELIEGVDIVSEHDGKVDLSWYLYESAILSLPLQCVHEIGDCDEAMTAYLVEYESKQQEEEQNEDTEQKTDSRWDGLNSLKEQLN